MPRRRAPLPEAAANLESEAVRLPSDLQSGAATERSTSPAAVRGAGRSKLGRFRVSLSAPAYDDSVQAGSCSCQPEYLFFGGEEIDRVRYLLPPRHGIPCRVVDAFLLPSWVLHGPGFCTPGRSDNNFVHGPARTRFWTSGDKKRWVYAACFVVVVCWPHNSAQSSWFRCLGPVKETFVQALDPGPSAQLILGLCCILVELLPPTGPRKN